MITEALQKKNNEKELIEGIQRGDVNAFDTIYYKYVKKLYSFAFGLLKDHSQTEELVQSVFVTLWEKRHQLNPNLRFSSYLFTICYNAVLKYFRSKNVEQKVLALLFQDSANCCSDTMATVYFNELNSQIEKTVEEMPPARKRVFRLSREQGKTTREIAEYLDISPRTVETHISQALKTIRVELSKAALL